MAKKAAKKPSGKKLPQEFVDTILRMDPKDLSAEAAREQIALDTLKKQLKDDSEIQDLNEKIKNLKDRVDTFEADLDMVTPVRLAKDAYEKAKDDNRDSDHDQALEDLAQAKTDLKLKKLEWKEDLDKRKATIKLMLKTFKSHLESGTVKSKL